ncbi:uridine kinase family protein [Paenibacillus mendelii]|uniref:Uridine kinase n=1 Tax=Paenibacillus mendelii TaxID=206163 RepID=A0ABV6JHC4_9BACL|nr:hypothetical protein [Paenibacillus mendelii]MCQ6557099.1 hypothetical protein [Paenibacillus mendelii]
MEPGQLTPASQKAVQMIVHAINQKLMSCDGPLVVAIDGGSGAGKSTLTAALSSHIEATVIHCDDFFSATISSSEWDAYSPEQKCRRCIDWQRVRFEVLEPLLASKVALYHPYSLETRNGLAAHWVSKTPAKVLILDGIYSAHPEISDIVHLTVLINVTPQARYERHNLREGHDDADWHARWDSAEDYYFTAVRPPLSFDLVIDM